MANLKKKPALTHKKVMIFNKVDGQSEVTKDYVDEQDRIVLEQATNYTDESVEDLVTQEELANKQDQLEAGENITIEGNVISATGGTGGVDEAYVQARTPFGTSGISTKNLDMGLYKLTQSTAPTGNNDVVNKRALDEAVAGITPEPPDLSNYYTKPETDTLLDTKQPTGDYATNAALATKQNTLTAGENITIENDVISSTGGTYVDPNFDADGKALRDLDMGNQRMTVTGLSFTGTQVVNAGWVNVRTNAAWLYGLLEAGPGITIELDAQGNKVKIGAE